MLFPPVPKTSVFEEVDYDYIHSELKKTGVNLKLLWNEYRNQCISKGTIPCGYTKFCKGYSNYVQLSNVTNHLTHKPGSTIEVDWLWESLHNQSYAKKKVMRSLYKIYSYNQWI